MSTSARIREDFVGLGQRNDLRAAVPATSWTVSVMSVGDRRTHEVREIDISPAARGGRYPTLCGLTITAASMAEPTRQPCPRCSELRAVDVEPRPAGILRRLVGW